MDKKPFTFSTADDEEYQKLLELKEYCRKSGTSFSWVITQATMQYLERKDDERTVRRQAKASSISTP